MTPEHSSTTRLHTRTHRLIASRWPTVGAFDSVASPEDLEAALLLETLTNDRVTETLARLGRLDRSEWVIGQPGSTLVMAAFCHPAPGGGRFNADTLGAWYCATAIETAVAETVYHHTRRLAHSASGFRHVIQMRQLISEIDAELIDGRGLRKSHPERTTPIVTPHPNRLARRGARRGRTASFTGACVGPAAPMWLSTVRHCCRRFSKEPISTIAGPANLRRQ